MSRPSTLMSSVSNSVNAAYSPRNWASPPVDSGQRSRVARTGSIAKLQAIEAAFRVVDRAVQLHGGRGVEHGSVVGRLYEDVRALRIYEGASDVQRLLIAKEILR